MAEVWRTQRLLASQHFCGMKWKTLASSQVGLYSRSLSEVCLKGIIHFHASIYMDMVGEFPTVFDGFTRVKPELQVDSIRFVLKLVVLACNTSILETKRQFSTTLHPRT